MRENSFGSAAWSDSVGISPSLRAALSSADVDLAAPRLFGRRMEARGLQRLVAAPLYRPRHLRCDVQR